MTHQTNAQRLAELMSAYERELQECGFPEPTRNSYDDGYIYENESERFCLFRHMRERLSAIEQARDVAVEMAAQYAAERDQLRAQLAALKDGQAGGQVVRVVRNDPVSALAIRMLVALEKVSQSDADHAFRLACEALEDEAQRMNVELPWVVRAPCPTTPKPVPMTRDRIIDIWNGVATKNYGMGWHENAVAFARSIEAHHGISEVQG